MPTYFFQATKNAHSQITKLFDFVSPVATAMWNLRWQVGGYLKVLPGATVDQLNARFSEGADIRGGNLKRACIDHTWLEQKDSFARIVLTNAIATYEGWIEDILTSLGKNTKALQKKLQFPDSSEAHSGVSAAIDEINGLESDPLRKAFHPSLSKGRNYALPKLNAMLLCYRFFKELRNCDMHGGGIASQRLIDAYTEFKTVATPTELGVTDVPAHTSPVVDTPITVSLYGTVGFTSVLLKIMATLDAELSRSIMAEKSFVTKWKIKHPGKRMLASNRDKRASQVTVMTKHAGFPKPAAVHEFGDWLNNVGLTYF